MSICGNADPMNPIIIIFVMRPMCENVWWKHAGMSVLLLCYWGITIYRCGHFPFYRKYGFEFRSSIGKIYMYMYSQLRSK